MMRRIFWKVGLAFVLMVGLLGMGWTFCAWILQAPYPWEWIILYRAQAGLERALRDLPLPEGFEMVTVIDTGGPSKGEEGGGGCYYAGIYIVLGTNYSGKEALERYVSALEARGWRLAARLQYEDEKFMTRAEQEALVIHIGGPGFIIEIDPGYQKARGRYGSFVYITLRYILPRVDGC